MSLKKYHHHHHYHRCHDSSGLLVVRDSLSLKSHMECEEESYSAELAEVELRVSLSLAKEADKFFAVYP